MDTIFIKEIKIDTVIGLHGWERRMRQTVIVDLWMGADIAQAAASEALADTLDYRAVSKRVQEFVRDSSFLLVEALAEGIAELILREFSVPWVRVQINKIAALRGTKGVGIVIERKKD
ncbi:MAG: dihydroneopterin aldolase [Ectothiorhodospiraceae bacterium AqS1]|nr:dihydroneopterin aldolase [Ectothiorhodospiraceae bacterium AqS1]